MNRWLLTLILIGATAFGIAYLTHTAMLAPTTVALALLALVAAQKVKWIRVLPIPEKHSTAALVIMLVVAFGLGAFTIFGPQFAPTGLQGLLGGATASVTGASTATGTPVIDASCKAQVASAENVGTASTGTTNAYDQESATPRSAAVDVNPSFLISDRYGVVGITDTSAYSLSSFSQGEKFTIRGGSASYYLDDKEICADSAAYPIELNAHAVATVGNMETTCYDSRGAACSTGTNASQEDYDVTLGANGETDVKLSFRVAAAVKSFRFKGVAVIAANDIAECYPTSPGFVAQATPASFKNLAIQDKVLGTANLTNAQYTVYTIDTPELIKQWKWKDVDFHIKASSTDPATNDAAFGSQDMCIVCAVDSVPAQATDGSVIDDFYAHTVAQGNSGLDELIKYPVGGDTCVVIEGI